MLDLFAGRLGWSRAFLARGWEVTAVDLVRPPEVPEEVCFIQIDVLRISANFITANGFDFVCASSPCEEFSVHGMKHFHPNPKYPAMGIKLFEHTRSICEASGVPYVIENVRAAQRFVGNAVHHCGPFYLWGSGVPPIMPQGIIKNWEQFAPNGRSGGPGRMTKGQKRADETAKVATIPLELANTVANYAECICKPELVQAGEAGGQ